MKEKQGEFIFIAWDTCSEVEYVRGHVDCETVKQAFLHYFGERDMPPIFEIKHRWARWVPASNYSDYYALFYTYDDRSNGVFAVTEVKTKP